MQHLFNLLWKQKAHMSAVPLSFWGIPQTDSGSSLAQI
jgi:hypothetical protein